FEHQRAADAEHRGKLVKSVTERKRQHVHRNIVLRVFQVLNDGLCYKYDVAVITHYALRLPSRSGRVNKAGKVEVNVFRRGRLFPGSVGVSPATQIIEI